MAKKNKTKAPTRFNKADSQLMGDILGWQKEARLKQPRYAKLRRMGGEAKRVPIGDPGAGKRNLPPRKAPTIGMAGPARRTGTRRELHVRAPVAGFNENPYAPRTQAAMRTAAPFIAEQNMEAQHRAQLANEASTSYKVARGAKGVAHLGLGIAMAGIAGKLGLKAVTGAGRLGVRAGRVVGHKLGLLKK
jgi:hypothetical protein